MRFSVEIEDSLVEEVMNLTGEKKMSTAVAKAMKLFVNRKKAVTMIRSLREEPLDYQFTNEEIENFGSEEIGNSMPEQKPTSYRKSK